MLTSLYYGYFDYWSLRHKVTFDGVNRLIRVNSGVTDLDVQTDLYSDWKEWIRLEDNLKYSPPFSTVGGDPTTNGQRLDVTYFLINGWRLKLYPGSYTLNIVGNLFEVDGGSIKEDADIVENISNNITINLTTSTVVRQVSNDGSLDPSQIVTASLAPLEKGVLYDIQGRVVSIENFLNTPLTSSLASEEKQILRSIETKLSEIWQLHGLDIENPLLVTQNLRTFGEVTQIINTTGTGSSQETSVERL